MPFSDPTSDLVITVSFADQLQDAFETLSNSEGGGVIQLTAQAEGLRIDMRDIGGSEPVHITSADPDNPVVISAIRFREMDNIKVSNVVVDNTGEEWTAGSGLNLFEVEQVEISDVTFTSFADTEYDPDNPDTSLAPSLGSIRESSDVVFANNDVSGYYQGLTVLETTDTDFIGNTFTQMQGDGIRMGGVQDIHIEGNHFHDFLGTVHSFNHNDFIQLWSTNAEIVSGNITITNNILDAGEGAGSQSIFMRNETYDQGLDDTHIYTNIEITNNLIYNGHHHGITVAHADGVTVSDNTLILNSDAGSTPPRINLSDSWNVTANNNIAGGVSVPAGDEAEGNLILDYVDPASDDYVSNHIINPFIGGDAELSDLRLRPDSDHIGTGAEASDPVFATQSGVEAVFIVEADVENPHLITLDARFSIDEQGFTSNNDYDFQWTFPDGSVQYGDVIEHEFPEGGDYPVELTVLQNGTPVAHQVYEIEVFDSTLLHVDFNQGLVDLSDYGSELSEETLISTPEGTVLQIGGQERFAVAGDSAQLHGLQSFDLSIELVTADPDGGTLLRLGNTLVGEVESDGSFTFSLNTDGGNFTVHSGDVTITDGEIHTINVVYSNEEGQLTLLIDEEQVDQTAATGTTQVDGTSSLILGSPWHETVEAQISDLRLESTADVAGEQSADVPPPDSPKVVLSNDLLVPQVLPEYQPSSEVPLADPLKTEGSNEDTSPQVLPEYQPSSEVPLADPLKTEGSNEDTSPQVLPEAQTLSEAAPEIPDDDVSVEEQDEDAAWAQFQPDVLTALANQLEELSEAPAETTPTADAPAEQSDEAPPPLEDASASASAPDDEDEISEIQSDAKQGSFLENLLDAFSNLFGMNGIQGAAGANEEDEDDVISFEGSLASGGGDEFQFADMTEAQPLVDDMTFEDAVQGLLMPPTIATATNCDGDDFEDTPYEPSEAWATEWNAWI